MGFYWCRLPDSNWPPDDYKSTALPNELSRRKLSGSIVLYLTRVSVGLPPFLGGSLLSSGSGEADGPSCAGGTAVSAGAAAPEEASSVATSSSPAGPGDTSNAMPCPFSRA